jgi:hypothetical protein
MNVPKYVQKAIKRAGKYSNLEREQTEIVTNWAEKEGLVDENFEDLKGTGISDYIIDSIEMGFDRSGSLITFLQSL